MSFLTWTTLTGTKSVEGSIRNLVNSSKVPATAVLDEAQGFIYARLRVREMIVVDPQMTFAAGDSEHDLPSGFQAPLWLKFYDDVNPLPYVHENMLLRSLDENGDLAESVPTRWTIIGNEIWLDVKHEEGNDAEFAYIGTPARLSASVASNFLTDRFPTVLTEACLSFSYRFLKDDARSLTARQRCEAEIREANKTMDFARFTQALMRG